MQSQPNQFIQPNQQNPQFQQLLQQQVHSYRHQQMQPSQQPINPATAKLVKQPTKRDNGDAIFWLLIFWPVGLYMMWKYATWPDVVKSIITMALVGFTLLWWLHSFA